MTSDGLRSKQRRPRSPLTAGACCRACCPVAQTRALADECAAMHDAKLLLPARTGATRSAADVAR